MYHGNLGGAALRDDDFDAALRNLEITTGLVPDWAVGWVNLGVTLSRLGRIDESFLAYRRAIELDPGNSSALNNMSILYRNLGRMAEARVALRAAAEQTESPFTLLAMADSEMLHGNNREAEKYLKKARRWYPREPEVYEGLARLAGRMGDTRRAEKYIRRARELSSLDPGDR
jgi:Flp pilus assembly protein TadD